MQNIFALAFDLKLKKMKKEEVLFLNYFLGIKTTFRIKKVIKNNSIRITRII